MFEVRTGGNVFPPTLESRPMIRLSRTIHFNAAHRLFRRDRSEEWNRATYGAAANPSGYGHNYALEVAVEGEIDPVDGMVLNLVDLDRILKEEIDRPLDHRNLNEEIAEFRETVPTAENLARWIWDRMKPGLPPLSAVTVMETPETRAIYRGPR